MRRIYLITVVPVLGACGTAHGQDVVARPLFDDVTPLELTIEAPFRELRRYGDDRQERGAIVRHRAPTGEETVLDAEIRVRGNSRVAICDFPPLRVDFDNDALGGTIFAGQNHLKLVTLCKRRDSYREYLAQEYQIYKAYNALTEYSFRARWASIEYVDADGRGKPFTEPAFFIEEDWEVAERNGLEALDVPEVPLSELDARHAALLALFQYMIGNTDWSAISAEPDEEDCCHNGKPIGQPGGSIIVLPYDFDFSGLIQTDYASPRSHLPIRSVRERLYTGYCAMNAELPWAVQRFNEERGAIERVFDAEPVDERTRKRTIKYLDDFYETINDPEELRDEVIGDCRSAD
jgi:hypothetical protein